GKSVLAKMMITGYLRHKNMSIYILDPQGEFSNEFSSNSELISIIKNDLTLHFYKNPRRLLKLIIKVIRLGEAGLIFKTLMDIKAIKKRLRATLLN
ncbi:MAG: helicase HerA domain-containing protein, partial [Candidatus Hodarchaeota archaeon]